MSEATSLPLYNQPTTPYIGGFRGYNVTQGHFAWYDAPVLNDPLFQREGSPQNFIRWQNIVDVRIFSPLLLRLVF